MARVYISAHHPDVANELADHLTNYNHTVTSTWHREAEPRPAANDGPAWYLKVETNFNQIRESDALVLIASPEHMDGTKRVAGGKFVEAGFAFGACIDVYTLGGVENGMLYGGVNVDSADGLLVALIS